MTIIDTTFNMQEDANGKDPDTYSKTLNRYHIHLWKKQLPNGSLFDIESVWTHKCEIEYHGIGKSIKLSSDSIVHQYHYLKRMSHIIGQMNSRDIDYFRKVGDTIGGYVIFPSEKINNKSTINTARGFHPYINDRFDFTLECIRRYYEGIDSPLYDTLKRYQSFFDLFVDFKGYVDFFLLNDLVNEDYSINFWLPFFDFGVTKSLPQNKDEYIDYMNAVLTFVKSRNKRIENYSD